MKKIKEYILASATYDYSIDIAVNKLLQRGFELYGNPVVSTLAGALVPAQAMVRYEQPDEVCWLIESTEDGQTEWYAGTDAVGHNWTTDANCAIHFCRQSDAKIMAGCLALGNYRITEHMFIEGMPYDNRTNIYRR